MAPVVAVKDLSVKAKKTQEGKSFKAAAGFGGVAHLKAMMLLPRGGVSRDGRNARAPRAAPHPRLTPPEAGVVRDVPRHRRRFCAAGGRNGDRVSWRCE